MHDAAEALNYVPSRRGRNLFTRPTGQVGVADLNNPLYLEIFSPVHEALGRADMRMLVLTSDTDGDIKLDLLLDGSLDGAIPATVTIDSPLHEQLSQMVPFVLLNREVETAPETSASLTTSPVLASSPESFSTSCTSRLPLCSAPEREHGRDRKRGSRE